MAFPQTRLRRLRQNPTWRRMVQETRLAVEDLIYPLFVVAGEKIKNPVPSLPGVYQLSVDHLVPQVAEAHTLGVPAVMLFGLPERKDEVGSEAWNPEGVVQKAVRALKKELPELVVITDVCLCAYTSHGHCGVVKEGKILNDPTRELISRIALSHAQAGADMVAPSDMMDGRIAAVREKLDAHGFTGLPILAYSAKYASAFYGPFREAAGSAPQFGDRKTYQMDPANAREALREVALDVEEGADMVMVKPALAYLDVIRQVKDRFLLPLAAYNVSGEYSLIKAAAARGWVEERAVVLEVLTGIKRAGADLILTYFAKDVARWLKS